MPRKSSYDKFPTVHVSGHDHACVAGWQQIGNRLRAAINGACVVDTYPGTLHDELLPALTRELSPARVIDTRQLLLPWETIEQLVAPDVPSTDPVFGRLTRLRMIDLFDAVKLSAAKKQIEPGTLIYGPGAALLLADNSKVDVPNTTIVLADLARWEIQRRQRAKLVDGIGTHDRTKDAWTQYRRGFFVDWRLADDHKRALWERITFVLDANVPGAPKLVTREAVDTGLSACVSRPFRVVPFFDPGVWGGQWMKEVCDLPRETVNYAWCFDCVPEENSLFLQFGAHRVELPSINLVFRHPQQLLGESVYGRFGAEFPIRFDFLDTMGGGNLSLQVHPLTEYSRKHFGIPYTQDESYYMLDAGNDACVYLGLRDEADPDAFFNALEQAQLNPDAPLQDEKFVAKWPAKKHDHFLIPAGTLHCSGRNAMVLEISATPYIFTFKLWDWGRLDLNGKPRPISLAHGRQNLVRTRNATFARQHLINHFEPAAHGEGWQEERTGLHEAEFIETRRHWFTSAVTHDTHGTLNVLNLVEGDEAVVESPTGAFAPFIVHYAETFIVPANVGAYTIRPSGPSTGQRCATMKAFVRSQP